jgi:two-component system nitrogen regulation response regulator NtrX
VANRREQLDELEVRAWEAFVVAYATIVPVLDRELGTAGVSLNQFEILTWLARAGRRGLRMSDLASRVVLSPSGVTRAVDQLERDGLVERRLVEGDKRGSTATLTADGRATLRKAVNVHVRGLREHFLQHLSHTELQQLADALEAILKDEGYGVTVVGTGEDGVAAAGRRPFDALLLDVWLPGIDGIETLSRIKAQGSDAEVVMISGHSTIETAVKATKLGAFDFVEKPLSLDKTVLVIRNALHQRRLEAENRALRARVDRTQTMVGESHGMRQLRDQVAMAAPTNGRVMVYGENGTGKELVARTIHTLSRRRTNTFVEVNCAAIPEELIESELFGHVRGAFTGAVSDRRGKFETADGGTIFLDEIGDMSLKTQAKVLRVLQEQTMEAVGGTARIKVDARVVAATNKDLQAEIRAGRFREDLYFRLNVIPIFVPALRDRQEDIPLLADHFMAEFAREYGRRPKSFDPHARMTLQQYPWPGNVRELRNVIERLMIMVPGDAITSSDLTFLDPSGLTRPAPADAPAERRTLHEARDQFERDLILRTLSEQQGNMSRTAEVLGVERSNLYRKMKAFGIAPSRRAEEESEAV